MQWNCRGLLHNLDDVEFLLEEHKPRVLCLQETHLNPSHTNFLRRYQVFRKDRPCSVSSSGGVAVVLPREVPCVQVPLSTSLEAVAVRFMLHKALTVCSLYLPPSFTLKSSDFNSFLDQLPEPFLLMGDFNCHNPLWGSTRRDIRGKIIESVLFSRTLCLFNTGEPTFFSCQHLSSSCIDLSIGTATLFPNFSWHVHPNPYGSDHFPIILKCTAPSCSLMTRSPRWKVDQADWAMFESASEINPDTLVGLDVNDACKCLTASIIEAAHKAIPQSSTRLPAKPKPWWTKECSETRKKQNCSWDVLRRYPTPPNVLAFKQARAKARYVRRQSKKTTWKKYTSSVNSHTSVKVVWEKVHKINGDYRAFSIPLFVLPGGVLPSLEQQANILGEHFASVSGSSHYSAAFLKHKSVIEKKRINCSGGLREPYNRPFTFRELQAALNKSKNTSPGPDRIHYCMLKHLHSNTLQVLLSFFNQIWREGVFPDSWKRAEVIPLLKQGKDPSLPSSYRPIALTSSLGKTFERMVNSRLVHFLEENHLLDKFPCPQINGGPPRTT